jgi:lipoate-protein ligase A
MEDGGGGLDGPANMAIDRALLSSVIGGAAPVLRLYHWSRPTVSFGRNQPARGLYDEAAAADRGITFVRRPTGGQAVLHDDELTYAVVAPLAVIGRPRQAYLRINQALVAGLREMGVDASVASSSAGHASPGQPAGGGPSYAAGARGSGESRENAWTAACFRWPERGEVVAGGRKLVGSAQRVESRTVLQHGSILIEGSQEETEELLVARRVAAWGRSGADAVVGPTRRSCPAPSPTSAASPGWTTLRSELGARPGRERLSAAVAAGFESVLGIRLAPAGLFPDEIAGADRLQERFASRGWTWRR